MSKLTDLLEEHTDEARRETVLDLIRYLEKSINQLSDSTASPRKDWTMTGAWHVYNAATSYFTTHLSVSEENE